MPKDARAAAAQAADSEQETPNSESIEFADALPSGEDEATAQPSAPSSPPPSDDDQPAPSREDREPDSGDAGGDADETPADDDSGGETNWLTDDISQRAAWYGISPEDAQSLGSAEALERTISVLDKQMFAAGQQYFQNQSAWYQQQQQQGQYQQQPQQGAQQGQQPQGQTTQQQRDEIASSLNLNPDDVGEDVVKAFQAIQVDYRQQIQQLQSQQQQLVQYIQHSYYAQQQAAQQQANEAYIRELTEGIKSLPADYKELFGDVEKLQANDPRYQNVLKLYETLETVRAGHAARGRQPPRVRDLVKNAAALAFPQQHEQTARRQASDAIQRRQQSATARPNPGSKNRGLSPDERATQRVERFQRNVGAFPDAYDAEEVDALL